MGATPEIAKILLVDDDRTWQIYLFSALQQGFQLRSAYTGEEALVLVGSFKPDCILLDINLPGKNGYEICRQLKAQPQTRQIPIIFLSAINSMKEKILGFELGGDDFLLKTTEAEILKAKIVRAVDQGRLVQELSNNMQSAQSAAFEAMSGSADLGCCLRFVERTYLMDNFERLAAGIFQTMEEFGLRVSLMMVTPEAPLFYSSDGGQVSPLEKEMFISTHDEGRFCDFGNRTFCNYRLISLLVKNMPLDSPERYGRIKDALPWILGAADSKVASLVAKEEMLTQLTLATAELGAAECELARVPESEALSLVKTHLTRAQTSCAAITEQLQSEAARNAPSTELGAGEIHSSGIDFF